MPPNDKFDVFVEGARDSSPEGLTRAAQALSPKLAMPTDRVVKLLGGRFRVRTSVDEEMARRLVADLERYGLRVAIAPTGSRPGGPAATLVPKGPMPPTPPAHPVAPPRRPPVPAPAAQASGQRPAGDSDEGISIGGLDGGGLDI